MIYNGPEENRAVKLSEFFGTVDAMWSGYSLPWLGMVAVIYVGIAYASNRFANTRRSPALLYGAYSFAVFFVLALTIAKSFDDVLKEPMLVAMIAALIGVGADVYRRLKRP